MKTKKQRKWCGARKECLRSFFVLLENDQRRTVEKGVKTCISMNLPTAENLLRRGNWRNNSGNAGIQGFCEEPAFKADIKYAGHYPVLWSPVPVWNNPKEPSDWEKVFFCEQWRDEDIDLEIGMKLENSVDYEKKLQENAIFRKYHWLIFDRSDLRFCVFSGIMYWD